MKYPEIEVVSTNVVIRFREIGRIFRRIGLILFRCLTALTALSVIICVAGILSDMEQSILSIKPLQYHSIFLIEFVGIVSSTGIVVMSVGLYKRGYRNTAKLTMPFLLMISLGGMFGLPLIFR